MLTKEQHAQLVACADEHQRLDEYIAGTYWSQKLHKGCAVGCAIIDCQRLGLIGGDVDPGCPGNHTALAQATGVPELVWRLADSIFERLPSDEQPAWPPRLLRSVQPDVVYTGIESRIVAQLMERMEREALREDVRSAASVVAALYRRRACGDDPTHDEWDAAREQADAAWAQAYAAREQAYAAWEQADAARAQAYAARAQAYAAWAQAYAAWEQAYAARYDYWRWIANMLCDELAATGGAND